MTLLVGAHLNEVPSVQLNYVDDFIDAASGKDLEATESVDPSLPPLPHNQPYLLGASKAVDPTHSS